VMSTTTNTHLTRVAEKFLKAARYGSTSDRRRVAAIMASAVEDEREAGEVVESITSNPQEQDLLLSVFGLLAGY
jgi:hypothetical protein